MGHFVKTRTLVNPGKKRRRKLSPKQIAIFGTKRQKAALRNSRRRKNSRNPKPSGHFEPMSIKHVRKARRKRKLKNYRNPSRILTLSLPNPSKKRRTRKKGTTINMARRKHRSTAKRVYRRRRHVANPHHRRGVHRRRRSMNPGKVVYRYRKARHHRRRGNPSRSRMLGGVGNITGILAGAAVTHIGLGMLPASLTTGFIGYVTTAAVAMVQGKVVGGVLKNRALGNKMVTGGLVYLGLKVISDLFPSISSYLPFSLRGMGLIAPSSFYVPQVNMAGSMGRFVAPAALPVPVAAGMKGINTPYPFSHNTRRTGRVS